MACFGAASPCPRQCGAALAASSRTRGRMVREPDLITKSIDGVAVHGSHLADEPLQDVLEAVTFSHKLCLFAPANRLAISPVHDVLGRRGQFRRKPLAELWSPFVEPTAMIRSSSFIAAQLASEVGDPSLYLQRPVGGNPATPVQERGRRNRHHPAIRHCDGGAAGRGPEDRLVAALRAFDDVLPQLSITRATSRMHSTSPPLMAQGPGIGDVPRSGWIRASTSILRIMRRMAVFRRGRRCEASWSSRIETR